MTSSSRRRPLSPKKWPGNCANFIGRRWRAVPFSDYGQEEITATAVSDLIHFPYFADWGDNRLFRGETPGDLIGPYISQF